MNLVDDLDAVEHQWTTVTLIVAGLIVSNVMSNTVLPATAYVAWNVSVAATLVIFASRRDRLSPDELGIGRSHAASGLRWGGACMAAVAAAYGIGLAIPATRALFQDRRASGTGAETAYRALIAVPFGTVLLEEVAFRGVLPAVFRRRTSRLRGAVWSSLLFGSWHVLPSWDLNRSNRVARDFAGGTVGRLATILFAVIGTAAAGMVFCWLRDRSRSLLAPIALHIATNSFGYLGAWLVLR